MKSFQEIIKYIFKFLGILILSFVLLLILSNSIQCFNIYKSYKGIDNGINEIKSAIKSKDIDQIFETSKILNNNLKILKKNINNIRFLQVLPYIRESINSINDISDIGISVTNIIAEAEPIKVENNDLVSLFKDNKLDLSKPEVRAELLNIIDENQSFLDYFQGSLNTIVQQIERNKNNQSLPSVLEKAWKPLFENYNNILLVKEYFPIIKEAPTLLGVNGSAKYLLLFQNNTELRPTGGFIGSYGILSIKNGDIASISTDNIYNLDRASINRVNIKPPEWLEKYLLIHSLFLRDSNYNPDYKVSAKLAENFYKKESQNYADINGVIAITPEVLKGIVTYFGEITVMGETFTGENVIELLNYETKFNYWKKDLKESERKVIIQKMADVLFERIKSLSVDQYKDIYEILVKNLEEKHFLLYFNNENVQSFIEGKNWAGRIDSSTNSDYVAVIDANLLSAKDDVYMKKDIDYTLSNENGELVATLSLSYNFDYVKNKIYEDTAQYLNEYKTYTRVYVPEGSWLISAQADDTVIKNEDITFTIENGKTSFGLYMRIPRNETVTYTFKYRLPAELASKLMSHYSLIFQKQAGLYGNNINFNINIGRAIKNTSINNDDIQTTVFGKNININGYNEKDIKLDATFMSNSDLSLIKSLIKKDYLSFEKTE